MNTQCFLFGEHFQHTIYIKVIISLSVDQNFNNTDFEDERNNFLEEEKHYGMLLLCCILYTRH